VVKDRAYAELLSALRTNHVRFVTTDYSLAHPITFLSGGTILAADGLGPFTVNVFEPETRQMIDDLAPDRKAYLFHAPSYPASPRHKEATENIRLEILDQLGRLGTKFRTVELHDYVLIVPENAASGTEPRK
jgi:hypothetical protein